MPTKKTSASPKTKTPPPLLAAIPPIQTVDGKPRTGRARVKAAAAAQKKIAETAPAAPAAKPDRLGRARDGLAAYYTLSPAGKLAMALERMEKKGKQARAFCERWLPEPMTTDLYNLVEDLRVLIVAVRELPPELGLKMTGPAGAPASLKGKVARLKEKALPKLKVFSATTRFEVLEDESNPLLLRVVGTAREVYLARNVLDFSVDAVAVAQGVQ